MTTWGDVVAWVEFVVPWFCVLVGFFVCLSFGWFVLLVLVLFVIPYKSIIHIGPHVSPLPRLAIVGMSRGIPCRH